MPPGCKSENKLPSRKIILASSSPRRKRILEILRLGFEVVKPLHTDEAFYPDPFETVEHNSRLKAQNIFNRAIIGDLNSKNKVIAGFDTIIYFDGRYFGKPAGREEARFFLSELSGKIHKVITGINLIDGSSGSMISGHEVTEVKLREIKKCDLEIYLNLEDFRDKAGAYDISGFGSILVEKINGCFYNVAGLPVFKFVSLLEKLGYYVFRNIKA